MSIESWTGEFMEVLPDDMGRYPKPITKREELKVLEICAKKWDGATKENLAKHSLDEEAIGDLTGGYACLLCRVTPSIYHSPECNKCILTKVTGDTCTEAHMKWVDENDPEPLRAQLHRAVNNLKAQIEEEESKQ